MNMDEIQRANDLQKTLKQHNINMNDIEKADFSSGRSQEFSSEMTEAEKMVRKITFKLQENEKQIEELKKQVQMLNSDIVELQRARKTEIVQKKVVVKQIVEEVEDNEDPYAKIYETVDNTPKLTKPIDRNRVAPADVQIDKIFYFGNKK